VAIAERNAMSVRDTKTIDLMTLNDKADTLWLTMTEERNWSVTGPPFQDLWAKVNFYIAAARSKEFQQQVPESRGKAIGIRLMCEHQPTGEALHHLSLINAGCSHYDLFFEAFCLDGDADEKIDIPEADTSNINVNRGHWDQTLN
jgi:hypothetical protein